jgi:hypothetical protein
VIYHIATAPAVVGTRPLEPGPRGEFTFDI